MERSKLYNELSAVVEEEYQSPGWPSAKRWRARVGIIRLVAERASSEAAELLGSPNLSIHRNEPELHELLIAAREAATAYNTALMRDNWRRYEGRPKEE